MVKVTPIAAMRATSLAEVGARQAIGGDAVVEHAAGLGHGVADLDRVAHAAEMPGAGETGRSGADDQHALAGVRRRAEPSSPSRRRGRRGSARPRGSAPPRRGPCDCSSSRRGDSRRGRGPPASDCRRPASARRPRNRRRGRCASQAWMFSPAGQALLQGGRWSIHAGRCQRRAPAPFCIVAWRTGVRSFGIRLIPPPSRWQHY